MKKLQGSHGVDVRWRSYELRPAGAPPMSPEHRARIEAGRPAFTERVRRDTGLTLKPGPFGISSRAALVLEKAAEARGAGEAFHDQAQNAYWLEGEDLSNPEVLRRLWATCGLPVVEFEAALADAGAVAAVDADVAQAAEYGLSGVPALVLNERYLVMGAQPYATLAAAVEKVAAASDEDETA
ncbi:MAG: DsbA family protein [Thermoflexales bacterium]|nr:DsbA family protein [Thermoflexales bacterium]